MSTDPLARWGLHPVTLTDRPLMEPFFQSLKLPLSDYTFSQLFTWRNSLRIAWTIVENHLCVFANGSGDLTLLIPPIGDTHSDRALAGAFEIMDAYNAAHHCPERSRIEYVSEELLNRFDAAKLTVTPQGSDYLYDVSRMIDLAGGDLASKRQARNRFMRNYAFRSEPYDRAKHFEPCRDLLNLWKDRQDDAHAGETSSAIKRTKESLATQLTLECADELGLKGMVVYVRDETGQDQIKGFTFGEPLGSDQSSIVVEKTDLECKGLAQYIFSQFCATAWSAYPLVNAGDDWGLESLAWTKNSYRPVKLLKKYVMTPVRATMSLPASNHLPSIENVKYEDVKHEDMKHEEAALAASSISLQSASLVQGQEPATNNADSPTRVPRLLTLSRDSAESFAKADPDLTIRPASRTDLSGVCAIEQSCFSHYKLNRRQLNYLQARQTAVFLVAEAEGRIVGEGIALVRHHKSGISGRIYSLAVDPARRRGGVGEKLLRAMIESLADQGARRIYLEVEGENISAVRLYQRLGFVNIGVLPDYYGRGHNGVHMMFQTAVPVAA